MTIYSDLNANIILIYIFSAEKQKIKQNVLKIKAAVMSAREMLTVKSVVILLFHSCSRDVF